MSDTPMPNSINIEGALLLQVRKEYEQLERELAAVTAERDELLVEKARAQETINAWLDVVKPSGWVYELRQERDALLKRLEGFDIAGLAYEQRKLPGPFSGIATPNEAATCYPPIETR